MDSNINWDFLKRDLYKGEIACIALQDTLTHSGPLKAWYRASKKIVQKGLREVNWFLTDTVLVRQEMNPDGLFLVSFKLRDMIRVERYYDCLDDSHKAIIKRAVITFTDGKNCDLSVPSPQFQGDVQGFEKLIQLLG